MRGMTVPPFRNWVSGSSLSVAIPVGLTAALGLWSVWPAMPDWTFYLYTTMVMICVLVAWVSAARQDARADAASARFDALIDRLANSATNTGVIPAHLHDLRAVKSDEIRKRVFEVASRMRAMENAFNEARKAFPPIATKTDWDADLKRSIAQRSEQINRWRTDLHPEALALWQEMLRRTYGAPPYPQDSRTSFALGQASLAGPIPLIEAAAGLEELARNLPG